MSWLNPFRRNTPTQRHNSRDAARFRPRLEGLEERCCPTTVTPPVNGLLAINGDNTANNVRIYQDDTANTLRVYYDVEARISTGLRLNYIPSWPPRYSITQTYVTFKLTMSQTFASNLVSTISVYMQDQDDRFSYELQSDLSHPKSVSVDGGAGHNYYHLDLDAGPDSQNTLHGNFQFWVTGNQQQDDIYINQTNATLGRDVNIDAGAMLRLTLNQNTNPAALGTRGADSINVRYRGQLNGHLDMRVQGGEGLDSGATNVHVLAGSFGSAYYSDDNLAVAPEIPLQNVTIERGSLIGLFNSTRGSAPANPITINGYALSLQDRIDLEDALFAQDPNNHGIGLLPSEFWYDSVSGAVGLIGQGTSAFGPAGLLAGVLPAVPANASAGTSGIFVNGRQITNAELTFLQNLINDPGDAPAPIGATQFFVNANGDAGQVGGGVLWNLITEAQEEGSSPRSGPLSTYDLTGISVLSDGDFLYILDSGR
jgi:hypothetical protein